MNIKMPSNLPLLPGNTFSDPTITRYHKTQLLGVKDGSMQEKTTSLKEDVNDDLLRSMREGNPVQLSGIPQREVQQNDAIPRIAPKWLKHDRQVLNFSCYFQEPVVEDPNENFRIRKCVMYYYLDDDTLHVMEKRQENSGIPQGVFLKRHKVPNPNGQGNYTWRDLNLSMNLSIYGRVFRITDCDNFTKQFYHHEGIALNAPDGMPDDPFVHTRAMINMKQNPPDMAETKEYVEVMLKGGRPNKNLKNHLDFDRKVLSFRILWDDRSYDGGEKYYILNFFLSDQSCEVKEVKVENSGKDDFSMLLKRMKLPKNPKLTHCPGMSLQKDEIYGPSDLICGQSVNIYGRHCMLYDCDAATRQWYVDNLGIHQNPIALRKAQPNLAYQPLPPHNNYGSEEDSLGSVVSLQPKVPKKDIKKMFKCDMHILRFEAKMISPEPDDETRKFIISFYCGDDTIQVYEVCDKNSGRMGGKFLERKKHKNPVNAKYYVEKDFFISATIYLGGHKFQLLRADEYTEAYMEDNPDQFPQANLQSIVDKIKRAGRSFPNLQDYAIHLIKTLDKNGDELIDFSEFSNGLRSMGIHVTEAEVHALVRRFDHNGDGKISMEEFYNTLSGNW